MFLRQSTAQTVRFGPFLDITDGVTEETALTLAQADMRLSKDGGAFAQKNASGNATHDSDGWYSTSLDTTDTATVGELIMNVHQPANTLPVWMRWWVVEEAVYDSIYGAAAAGPLQPTVAGRTLDVTAAGEAGVDLDNTSGTLDAAQIGANAITSAKIATGAIGAAQIAANAIGSSELATDAIGDAQIATGAIASTAFAAGAIDAAAIAPDAIGASELAADAVAEIADAVWDEPKAGHVGATTFGDLATDLDAALADTADMQPKLGAPAADLAADVAAVKVDTAAVLVDTGTTLSADIAAVQADTDDLQTRIPAALVGGRTDASVGAMAANVLTASALATDAVNEIRDAIAILPVKNAAFSDIPVFMVLTTDHVTASTGLTLGVTRSIDGGAFGAGTGTATEIATGMYQYDASAADMNGTMIIFRFTGTASDDTFVVVRTAG